VTKRKQTKTSKKSSGIYEGKGCRERKKSRRLLVVAGLILRDKPTDGNFDNDLPPRHRTKKAIYQTFVSVRC
jgi:hypothetical protein